MNVLIIEDEAHATRLLIDALTELRPDLKVLCTLDSVKASLNWLEENTLAIDMIFMDIELADGSSFEIFNHIQMPAPVVFTTAYDQYALEAFKVNAIDYLLKPIDSEMLAQVIMRWSGQEQAQLGVMRKQLDEMASAFSSKRKHRCLVKKGGAFEFVNVEDIAMAYSEESVTFLVGFDGNRNIYSRTIEQLCKEVDSQKFYQINRAQIINIENILQVHPYLGQRLKLKVKSTYNEMETLVSRQRASDFKEWLDS